MRRLLPLLSAAFLATLAAPALAGTVSIQGHGEVTAAPDTAFITSGVTTQAPTAREALDANTDAMTDLITALKEAGIEARDIQTSGFSVTPNYVYSDARDESGYTLPPRIDGYQVTNTVSVRVRALDQLGAILDRSVTVGANTISGVSFAVDDTAELLNEARKQAYADAREKAELYATLAGGELEDIVSISESQNYSPPQPLMALAAAPMQERKDVPVEAGELAFSIDVSVEWNLDTTD